MTPFRDRSDAGRHLATRLRRYRGANALVLGLPRGGVPVANEVARALSLPLDILVVRKLGAPLQPELGIGAVAEGGVLYIDASMAAAVGASRADIDEIARRETAEVARRIERWRGARPPVALAGRVAIVVDDGIATGGTVRAALRALRKREPAKIVLAVPVASTDTLASLAREADEIVCVLPVGQLWSVGEWYRDFTQVSDDVVAALLDAPRPDEDDDVLFDDRDASP